MRNREKGTVRLVLDLGGWAYLTKESLTTESNQGAFVNQIRKKIKKSRLDSITQLNGDRIICFEFSRKDEKLSLIFEFFHKGNAILCVDNQIEMVMRQQKFRHRKIVANETYISPLGFNPFNSNLEEYSNCLLDSDRGLGASLTINCNLGGEIANLICENLNLEPNSEVSETDVGKIHSEVEKILVDKIDPTIFIDENGENITVSKFNLANLKADKKYPSFDEAIEIYLG